MIDPNIFNVALKTALVLTLIYLAYIDWRSFLLPNSITIPLMFSGILLNCVSELRLAYPVDAIIGAFLGYAILWSLNSGYRLFSHRNGIGMGDAKLLAALGAWFGFGALAKILLISSLLGVIGGLIWLKWNRHHLTQAFPFGPFLAIAGIIELLCPQIIPTLPLTKLI